MENASYPDPPENNQLPYDVQITSSHTLSPQSPLETRKRSTSQTAGDLDGSRNKARKVSRACDFCKSRKAKCTGDRPCAKCVAKGVVCSYDSKYTRGRPPTPLPSSESLAARPSIETRASQSLNEPRLPSPAGPQRRTTEVISETEIEGEPLMMYESNAPSRASPELSMAEIQGQVFDPTSGLTFLHRALRKLSDQRRNDPQDANRPNAQDQPIMTAGDKSLPRSPEGEAFELPAPFEARLLLSLYFDVCIATYRILHRPTVELWLGVMEKNLQSQDPIWRGIGRARAAIVLAAFAMASLHRAKSEGFLTAEAEAQALASSDKLFARSATLADEETGFPRLESAQAKVIHVLYLLTTSRFNRAWYTFGNVLQLVSALGLHRRLTKQGRLRTDYIQTQCGIRTFWTAYILDNYLGVIFGRPRHYHDEDIDQEFPDKVEDELMQPTGPELDGESFDDCNVEALIFHARIAQIIGSISRRVYTPRDISKHDRCTAATELMQRVRDWHTNLPLHLGSVRPSILIPSFRRQATVLKLAYSHSIMHANRLFLLGNSSTTKYESQIKECIMAAKSVLYTVDRLAREGPIFHAFWWTHYVTFCALMVTYVWEAQQRRATDPTPMWKQESTKLLELAEKCQMHLANATASNSPSRRYAVILEEFRTTAAMTATEPQSSRNLPHPHLNEVPVPADSSHAISLGMERGATDADYINPNLIHPLDEWNTMDWLALDSSAFWPYFDSSSEDTGYISNLI